LTLVSSKGFAEWDLNLLTINRKAHTMIRILFSIKVRRFRNLLLLPNHFI
jgi:hypothetical protein